MRTERIYFDEVVSESDGAGGFIGTLTPVFSCMAEWEALKQPRQVEANQVSLRQGYVFLMWIAKRYEPKVGTVIRFLDEHLTIQSIVYADQTRTRYKITAIEQISNGE